MRPIDPRSNPAPRALAGQLDLLEATAARIAQQARILADATPVASTAARASARSARALSRARASEPAIPSPATRADQDGWVGVRYATDRSVVEVAKLIRADLKRAIEQGELPSINVQVLAGSGRSIHVRVKSWPETTPMFEPLNAVDRERLELGYSPRYSEQAAEVLRKIRRVVEAYNFDYSDISTDYFRVNFYHDESFDPSLESREKKKLLNEAVDDPMRVAAAAVQTVRRLLPQAESNGVSWPELDAAYEALVAVLVHNKPPREARSRMASLRDSRTTMLRQEKRERHNLTMRALADFALSVGRMAPIGQQPAITIATREALKHDLSRIAKLLGALEGRAGQDNREFVTEVLEDFGHQIDRGPRTNPARRSRKSQP